MQAIVICHVSNPGISVLLESIKVYAPTIPVYIYSVDVAATAISSVGTIVQTDYVTASGSAGVSATSAVSILICMELL